MNIPEKGFYYHYKHDSNKGVSDHAYFVLGVAKDTEDDCEEDFRYEVIYQPLYDLSEFLGEKIDLCKRPLEMFMDTKEVDGKMIERFQKINDLETIKKLQDIRSEID